MAYKLIINGKTSTVDVPGDMPLLWVIRDVVGLKGTKFGCGVGQCGACTVHVRGRAVRSCQTQVQGAADTPITTLEGLSADGTHPVADRLAGRGRPAVRLLPGRTDDVGRGAARDDREADRRRHRQGDERQHLPLRHVPPHPRSHPQGGFAREPGHQAPRRGTKGVGEMTSPQLSAALLAPPRAAAS